ncbi:hypothetical protein FB45DRAFT_133728 [Roridomyces roridus]|uniref:Uncharacterized protein n=1 Tax=Roridomyces roridus TaxID=1738132 RepID=A0AAD7BH19_9AGAR|nr:hypothetical protein FB45DRAFT_133728 [Roridomyces roridus]
MPVSFRVATHPAQTFQGSTGSSANQTLSSACRKQASKLEELIQFSLTSKSEDVSRDIHEIIPGLVAEENGFVATLIEAYTKDRALIIRPDDVWLAIMSQFNFFVTACAELLLASFVAHEGQRALSIDCRPASFRDIDFGDLAR